MGRLINKIKETVFGYKISSESYIRKLKQIGVSVGDDVILYRPYNTTIDVQNPHLLTIGNHVMITGPVTILTHDYSWSVLKHKYGYIVGNQKPTIIGNNVFIGWGATILGGTVIGDNTIIGANSVVSGKLEKDSVYAGNPAKKIMSIEEFYDKRMKHQLNEAVNVAINYKNRFGTYPNAEVMNEYFYLFTNKVEDLNDKYISQLELVGNYEECLTNFKNNVPKFDSYEEFINYCKTMEN